MQPRSPSPAASLPVENPLTALEVGGVDLLAGGSVAGASYDPATGVLTLSGAAITAPSSHDGIKATGNLTIRLEGTNTITGDDPDYRYIGGVSVNGDLTLTGDGSLTLSNVTIGMVASSLKLESGVDLSFRTRGNAFLVNAKVFDADGNRVDEDLLVKEVVLFEGGRLAASYFPPKELLVDGADLLAGGSVAGVSYDPDTNTLTLTNAAISSIEADGDLTLEVKGENTISGSNYGIYLRGGGRYAEPRRRRQPAD